jgi:hypothetical protein
VLAAAPPPALLLAVLQAVTKAAADRHATANAGRVEMRLLVGMRAPPDESCEMTASHVGY